MNLGIYYFIVLDYVKFVFYDFNSGILEGIRRLRIQTNGKEDVDRLCANQLSQKTSSPSTSRMKSLSTILSKLMFFLGALSFFERLSKLMLFEHIWILASDCYGETNIDLYFSFVVIVATRYSLGIFFFISKTLVYFCNQLW